MKDLELRDIIDRKARPNTKISVYLNGRWSFATLQNPLRSTVDQQFFRIDHPFGLHPERSTNPAKYKVKGKPGEYVSVDRTGTMDLVTVEAYTLRFPAAQQIPLTTPDSDLLKNPNFLTKTQLESVDKDSDKVLIGDKEFSLPSTTKKTLSIIETPAGQAQAYYDASALGYSYYDPDLSATIEVPVPDKPY